jgi:hypothetical protein
MGVLYGSDDRGETWTQLATVSDPVQSVLIVPR